MKTPVGWRIALMIGLVAAFAVQTYLVYSDPTGEKNPALSEQALAGREIWLSKNCQVCHQLYGFGGFLGPDLTNSAPRLERNRLKELLTTGSKQMPAFHMTDTEIAQLYAFLSEIDKTGIGEPSRPSGELSLDKFEKLVNESDMSAAQRSGSETFLKMCTACHKPLADSLVGNYTAPDPTKMSTRMDIKEIRKIINSGRPDKGMPAFGFSGDKADNVVKFLSWLAKSSEQLEAARDTEKNTEVDWFEYKQ